MTRIRTRPAATSAPALLYAIAAAFVVAPVVAMTAFVRDPVSIRPICAFGDGIAYCGAALGHRVFTPFSRRPVAPAIAHLLPSPVGTAFRTISVASLLIAISLAVILGDRIAKRLGVGDVRSRAVIAIVIAGAGLACPHGLRLAWSVPVLVDTAALAAGLVWLTSFTLRDQRAALLSVPAAVLASSTREVWGPVIVITALATLVVARRRGLAALNVLAAGATFIVVTRLLPAKPQRAHYSEVDVVRFSWHQNFGDVEALRHTAWVLVFGLGLVPLILLCRPPLRWLRTELADGDVTATALLLTAVLLLGSGLLTGGDLTRYVWPAGFLAITLSAPWLVAHRNLWLASLVLAVATIAVWNPAHHLIATEAQYFDYYYGGPAAALGGVARPNTRTTSTLVLGIIAFAVALQLAVSTTLRRRAEAGSAGR